MVITSWISFAVSFDVVPGRLGLLLTVLLMMINMNNTIATSIPKSDSMCPLIIWVLISIIFIIFALAEYFIILVTVKFGSNNTIKSQIGAKTLKEESKKNYKQWATALDKTSLAIFPFVYLTCVFIFCLTMEI